MVDYYWAKEHSKFLRKDKSEQKEDADSDKKEDKDMKDCLNLKAPDYLSNMTGICYPQGIPPTKTVKLS